MRVSKELQKIHDIVLKLLTENPRYRESDKVLSAKIWSTILGGNERLKHISAYDFLCEYVKDESILPSQESIGRSRRKIQEHTPELRGKNYKEKQEEQADVVTALGYGAKKD